MKRLATGEEREAGVFFAQGGFRWVVLGDQMMHEEIQAVMRRKVRPAPSLLSEDVALLRSQ